jgi:hypothetical protein
MEIVKNIYQIPGVFANAYLIVEPEGLTLIDAGVPGSGKKSFNSSIAWGVRRAI